MSFQFVAERSSVILVAWQLLTFWLAAGAAVVAGEGQTVEYLGRSADDEQAVWGQVLEFEDELIGPQAGDLLIDWRTEVIGLEVWGSEVDWMTEVIGLEVERLWVSWEVSSRRPATPLERRRPWASLGA